MKYYLHKVFFLFALAEFIAAALLLLFNPGVKASVALATQTKQEALTELYFENHEKLPHIITPFTQYSFTFTIHNVENRDMVYPYEVYVDLPDEKLFLDRSTINIKKNEFKTIQEHFLTTQILPPNKVVVRLVGKNQQISFWIKGK